jgi:cytochrome b6-f complex iron-sulfur subunit
MDRSDPSRRRFLTVVAAGTASVATGCGGGDDPITGPVAAGNVKDLPENTLRAVGDQPVAIGRDAGGVYAMTLVCTHEDCNIGTEGSVAFSGLICGCHSSKFDANGAVTGGPAESPLEHYQVDIDGAGEMTIQGGTVVASDTRTAVPS